MRHQMFMLALAGAFTTSAALGSMTTRDHRDDRADRGGYGKQEQTVQLGPRPFFLVEDMQDSRLKRKLQSCSAGPFRKSSFSIGHRGAALQFPEHTKESYEAGALMGAGILECDVTFTKDLELVCRHAQNDLQTTTNILVTPLASQCFRPFTPAVIAADGTLVTPATAECRTSDITLAEFKTLTGKMDAFNPRASTPQEFLGGTANFRTDLYAGPTSGHLLTHRESIALFKKLGVQMTPELKSPSVPMPFNGFTQEQYAQKMIDEYKASGVSPTRVAAVVRSTRRSVLDQSRAGVRTTGRLPGRCEYRGGLACAGRSNWLHAAGHQHLGAADLRAPGRRLVEQDRAVPGCQGREGSRAGHHHVDA
jgi:glycerophosphoryl diester phosphodiesterase